MRKRLLAALSLEILALATPIASTFGFMVYRATGHPRECAYQAGCGDFSAVLFLLCVAIFGPALWLTAVLARRRLALSRKQLIWLGVANSYAVAGLVLLMTSRYADLVSLFVPHAGWVATALIAVIAIASISAIAEPRSRPPTLVEVSR